jgi:hypothetical protein
MTARVIDDAELCRALEGALSESGNRAVTIARFVRRPSPYRTSAALEELDLELDDGACLQLIFKDAGRDALHESARRVKPAFLCDPRREIETYRRVLAGAALGTAFCYGAVADEQRDRYWLFLERVEGVELYQVGALATWQQVARWLAGMHVSFARAGVPARAHEVHAVRHDARSYRMWLDRARFAARRHAAGGRAASQLERLASRHDVVVDRLTSLPATLVHGEFYASNVLVCEDPLARRVCPVDWETTAVGPGLIDLAALITGWPESERREIASAYYAALPADDRAPADRGEFFEALACCHIQIAVQWLGWFGRHPAPAGHARDWLGEAVARAEEVGL